MITKEPICGCGLVLFHTEKLTSSGGTTLDFDSKSNFDGSITVGLGNNFALQYRNFEPKSADTRFSGIITTGKIATNEFNVLYKLDKNVAAFAGYASAKGTMEIFGYGSTSSDTKNLWQVGLVGSTAIADKTTLWGSVAAGSNLTNWEVGVSYAFTPNLELNVNYREVKVDDLQGVDVKAKGLGLGVTFKF
jgi:predicted porin